MSVFDSRLVRLLRNRTLAIVLIALSAVYVAVLTSVPQGDVREPVVAQWAAGHPGLERVVAALGLHAAYTHPVFLLLMAVLAACTAACAWERTRGALRLARSSGQVSDSLLRRVREHPAAVIEVPRSQQDPLLHAGTALRRLGLRSRRGPKLLEASSSKLGLAGSPVFHWALVALIVVIAVGQLSRYGGLIGVPVGGAVVDERSSYPVISRGPLAGAQSGLVIAVPQFFERYRANGVDQGPTPVVELRTPTGAVLARQPVHPNRPLSHWPLIIHSNAYGLAPKISLESSKGADLGSIQPLIDFDANTRSGTTTGTFELPVAGVAYGGQVTVEARSRNGALPRLLPPKPVAVVTLTGPGGTEPLTFRLTPGASARLPDGSTLRLDSVTYYARLAVQSDWSIYPVFALFVAAMLGITIAVFMPYRTAWVLLLEDGGGARSLHVVTRHYRRDPSFQERVATALSHAESPDSQERPEEVT